MLFGDFYPDITACTRKTKWDVIRKEGLPWPRWNCHLFPAGRVDPPTRLIGFRFQKNQSGNTATHDDEKMMFAVCYFTTSCC